jgi:hypothetical protein
MKTRSYVAVWALCLAIPCPTAASAEEAAAKRLDVDRHFPERPAVLVRLDGARLARHALGTPWGRMLSHPGIARALGTLPRQLSDWLRAETAEFAALTGVGWVEFLGLFRGEVALALYDVSRDAPPGIVAAIELGERRQEILGVVSSLKEAARRAGHKLAEIDVRGIKATAFPVLGSGGDVPPILAAEIGSHLVLCAGKGDEERLGAIALAFASKGEAPAGGAPAALAALQREAAVTDRAVFACVDLAALLAGLKLDAGVGPDGDAMAPWRYLKLAGLAGISTFGYALGAREGDFEARVLVRYREQAKGLLQTAVAAVEAVSDASAALERIPLAAKSLGFASVHFGRLLLASLARIEEEFPESQRTMREVFDIIEEQASLTLPDDLARFGKIDLHGFSVRPPAGGLINDSFYLVRSSEFAPYRALFEKLLADSEERLQLEVGGKKIDIFHRPLEGMAPLGFLIAGLNSLFGFAWVDLDGGWTLLSPSVHSLRRYLEHYARGPMASSDAGLLARLRRDLGGGPASLLRGGRSFVAYYNGAVTLLNAAAPFFDRYLEVSGIDPALLPIGEEFLDGIQDGSIRLVKRGDGFDLETRALLTASADNTLAVVGGLSIIAGFLVPTLVRSREVADEIDCQNKLKEIAKIGILYADDGHRFFPHSEKGSIESLQILVDWNERMRPEIFVCRRSMQVPAERGADGKYRLTKESCSYVLNPRKLAPTDDAPFIWDSEPRHDGRRCVARTDSSVQSMDEEEFQRLLQNEKTPPRKEGR